MFSIELDRLALVAQALSSLAEAKASRKDRHPVLCSPDAYEMSADPKGRDLFIGDESVSGWTGPQYLEEWSGIAKACITHARLEVVGAQVLVGFSNCTAAGLAKAIELNIRVQSAREVAQPHERFESHRNAATEVSGSVIETISRHTRLYTPFLARPSSGCLTSG